MNAVKVKVGELFAPRPRTVNPARHPDETFELYSVPAYDHRAPDVLLGRDIGSAKQVVAPGDVLLSKIVPHIRRAWVVGKSNGHRMLASSEWIVLNSERADPRYLRFLLMCDEFHRHYMQTVGGVGGSLLRAQRDQVAQIEARLPELGEQERISNVLEAMSRGMALESLAVSRSTDLKAEVMSELFTRGLRDEPQRETEIGPIPQGWKIDTVGDHFGAVSGGTPARSDLRCWTDGSIPWVKSTEVGRGTITSTGERITPFGLASSAAKLLPAGTILVAMYGETRGKIGLLAIDATCNQACAALKPSDEVIDPTLLRYWLEHRYEDTRQRAHGGAQQNLNLDIIRQLPIAFPVARDEQGEIAAIIGAVDQKIDLHKRKRVVLEQLFKALLNGLMTDEISVSSLNLSAMEKPTLDGTAPTMEATG